MCPPAALRSSTTFDLWVPSSESFKLHLPLPPSTSFEKPLKHPTIAAMAPLSSACSLVECARPEDFSEPPADLSFLPGRGLRVFLALDTTFRRDLRTRGSRPVGQNFPNYVVFPIPSDRASFLSFLASLLLQLSGITGIAYLPKDLTTPPPL